MEIEVLEVTAEITYQGGELSITGDRYQVFGFIEDIQEFSSSLANNMDEQEKMRDKIRTLEYQLEQALEIQGEKTLLALSDSAEFPLNYTKTELIGQEYTEHTHPANPECPIC